MTGRLSSTAEAELILTALAVVGRADAAALAALLGDDGSGETAEALAAGSLAALASHPDVQEQPVLWPLACRPGQAGTGDGWWVLSPDAASAILASLQRDDLPRYRLLHERAVAHLAGRLRTGEQAAEPVFLAVLDRLASRLLLEDPEGFAALIGSVRDVPLAAEAGRQLRRYFEGVALALSDRYGEALAVFDELLAEPGLDVQVRGRALNSRAIYCRITGRLEEALIGFQASLDLWRRLGNKLRQGLALLNLGIVAYELQEYDEAEDSLHQAARCFEEVGSSQWLASAQNELGLIYRDQGRWEEALACFNAATTQRRAEGAQDSLGRALNNIGEVLLFQSRLDEAAVAFREALAAMSTRVYAVDTHLNLGLVCQAAGDLPGARAAFQAALDLALTIGRRDILAQVHYRLGEALRRLGEDVAALAQFEAAAQVIEATREPLHKEELKISLLGRWQQVYEALVLHCLAIGRPDAAFAWSEHARARSFADAVGKTDPDLQSSIPDLHPPPPIPQLQANLPADAALLCYFTTGVLDRDLPLLRALPTDSPLREHLLTPARTLLFVLTRDSLAVHECPLDPNAFASASPRRDDRSRFLAPAVLRRLHAALLEPLAPVSAWPGDQARQPVLWPGTGTQEVPVRVAGDALAAGRLYLVPHGPLHHVPFGALTDRNGQPLLRTGGPSLAYAPSATVLAMHWLHHGLAPRRQGAPRRPCLAVGHDGAQSGRAPCAPVPAQGRQPVPCAWPQDRLADRPGDRLRHTEAEATFVASLTGGESWVGPQPKKERLRLAAGDARWLHFACHGQFNHESPLDSYLETGAGERLTALEVMRDWRLQAELVTLSACQTGVSRVLRGDEPMGLVRAFLYAGARAVLVSQWPVEDLPTFLLMQCFYGELQRAEGTNPAAALQTAQVWLRELTAARTRELLAGLPGGGPDPLSGLPPDVCPFAHPRYWAAFILVGETGDRKTTQT
jgi:CHAT domain-containing protein/tetratricopeptide (TPR) repeat protein